ncbi:MAG: hypothetical protein JW699_04235 [Chitinispirillaceae bacterium]|nr:hypothetical protein [Chitinispirillaceae bacterium]
MAPIKPVLIMTTLLSIAPLSALSDSSAARQENVAAPESGTGADTAAADSIHAPETAAPALSADSAFTEADGDKVSDSALSPALPDTAGASLLADTAAIEDTSFFELIPVTVEFADSIETGTERRCPGVPLEQHRLARRMLDFFYDAAWDSSENTEEDLVRLETKHDLPPLSALLAVGIRVLRVLHGEYENAREKKGLLREIDRIAARGLELSEPGRHPDSCRAVNLLITGGIRGFCAALEIDKNPINAAINGLSSLRSFKKAVGLDSMALDAYLGVAMYHCIMSRAPPLVRGALALAGKKVSLGKGLEHLRVCAYRGSYTNEVALLLLGEFLSPYVESETEEKRLVVGSLQRRYPHNPFFVFLELDEDLCFHQEDLADVSYKDRIQAQIRRFTTSNPSSRRYANLVKWQYLLIDPFPSEELAPDKEFNLRRFSYYPVFLQAVREKIVGGSDTTETDRTRRLRFIRAMGAKAERMLDASDEMPQNRKGLYLWHIRDALRVEKE